MQQVTFAQHHRKAPLASAAQLPSSCQQGREVTVLLISFKSSSSKTHLEHLSGSTCSTVQDRKEKASEGNTQMSGVSIVLVPSIPVSMLSP